MYVVPAFVMPSGGEWVLILVIVLIIFGPGKLPEVFTGLGKGVKAFKDAQKPEEPTDVTPPKQLDADGSVMDVKEVDKAKLDR
jgi:sec-independent protein translocase protein TatA